MARKINRKNDPALLREYLDGGQIMSRVFEIIGWLQSGWMPVYSKPTGPVTQIQPEDFRVEDWDPLSPSNITRLRSALDFHMKLLAKLLPDLKSIEVNDISAPTDDRISPEERATKLFQVLNSLPEGQAFLQSLDPSQSASATTGATQPRSPSKPPPSWH